MNGQASAVHVVGLLAELVEKLGIAHGDKEVEGIVRVAHDEKQGGLLIADGIQLQLIIGGDLPELGNIERRESRSAGNQDAFGCFA